MSLLHNTRATFDYTILEEMEVGIELLGTEVHSIRTDNGSLKGARVIVRGGEAYLIGAHIPPWQSANTSASYDPERPRRLLLEKRHIARLASAESEKGLTIIPIQMYNKHRYLKLRIAIVRGKKKEDKRHSIREREEKRRIDRTLKQ